MRTDNLFHPYHVVPASEFQAAFAELSNQPESHASVEQKAVFCKEFVLIVRKGDACIYIKNVLHGKNFFQRIIKSLAYALFFPVTADIHRNLGGMLIGSSGIK